MSDKTPYSLDHFAATLAAQRDEHRAAYNEQSSDQASKFSAAYHLGRADEAAHALALLHIHTNGDFGQLRDEQPGGTR